MWGPLWPRLPADQWAQLCPGAAIRLGTRYAPYSIKTKGLRDLKSNAARQTSEYISSMHVLGGTDLNAKFQKRSSCLGLQRLGALDQTFVRHDLPDRIAHIATGAFLKGEGAPLPPQTGPPPYLPKRVWRSSPAVSWESTSVFFLRP